MNHVGGLGFIIFYHEHWAAEKVLHLLNFFLGGTGIHIKVKPFEK